MGVRVRAVCVNPATFLYVYILKKYIQYDEHLLPKISNNNKTQARTKRSIFRIIRTSEDNKWIGINPKGSSESLHLNVSWMDL